MDFAALHYQTPPLVIANVWDAVSAIAAQQAGYQALGTSSAAIAVSLGYEDGEGIPFKELLFIVKRIKSVSDLPLTVDMEAGYGDSAVEVAANIKALTEMGVVGINLEDSRVIRGGRILEDAATFAAKLHHIRHKISEFKSPLFINVRTDTFLLGLDDALEQTLYRGHLYAESGADGLFVPGIIREMDITSITRELALPLNVMCMPGLPDFSHLGALGVRRISMGNALHDRIQKNLARVLSLIQFRQSFSGVFNDESY